MKFGCEKVTEVIEHTLIRSSSSSSSSSSDTNNTPSLSIVEALIMAAIDENTHLDCVYFLLRGHPDLMLVKLLSQSSPSSLSKSEASASASASASGVVLLIAVTFLFYSSNQNEKENEREDHHKIESE
jgi:hypothetical protein